MKRLFTLDVGKLRLMAWELEEESFQEQEEVPKENFVTLGQLLSEIKRSRKKSFQEQEEVPEEVAYPVDYLGRLY